MKYIKLTFMNNTTNGAYRGPQTQWGKNTSNKVKDRIKMCKNGIHFYRGITYADAIFVSGIMDGNHGAYLRTTGVHMWTCKPFGKMIHDKSSKSCSRGLTTYKLIKNTQDVRELLYSWELRKKFIEYISSELQIRVVDIQRLICSNKKVTPTMIHRCLKKALEDKGILTI